MQDEYGNTALIGASFDGYLETTKLLVHRGAVVNFQRKVRLYSLEFGEESNLVVAVVCLKTAKWDHSGGNFFCACQKL